MKTDNVDSVAALQQPDSPADQELHETSLSVAHMLYVIT